MTEDRNVGALRADEIASRVAVALGAAEDRNRDLVEQLVADGDGGGRPSGRPRIATITSPTIR
ncbi:hypothetical protein [Streptomyces griseus]|uniref:hypothetical protein n=1 Tax=Streptomyces griseus TaxID=1911 RepID=UPI0036876714